MLSHKDNFKLWFRNIIEPLYVNEHAGFSLLMLTFPLLERYLRSKSKTPENFPLKDPFYGELMKFFTVLPDKKVAKQFWHVYRNGILHQATLSQRDRSDVRMPDGWLSSNKKDIEIDSYGTFWVNPVEFATHVMDAIDKDFSYFESTISSNPPLARVQTTSEGYDGTCSGNAT